MKIGARSTIILSAAAVAVLLVLRLDISKAAPSEASPVPDVPQEERAAGTATPAGSAAAVPSASLSEEPEHAPSAAPTVETAASAAPTPAPLSAFAEIEPVREEKFGLLMQSIFQMHKLDFPGDLTAWRNVGTPWQEWARDNYKLTGDVEQLIVRFEYPGEIPPDTTKASSFYIGVTFEDYRPLAERMTNDPKTGQQDVWRKGEGIILRHNLPKRSAEADGVRIPIMASQQQRVFVGGRDQTAVVAIVPNSTVRGVRGLLLCPRDYDLWKLKGGRRTLDNTGYLMAGVEARVNGAAQAKVNSGFGPGLARASVQVTSNILPSRVVEDEARTIYPYASVQYLADDSARQPEQKLPKSVTAGIKIQTVLHNSLNHKTISTGTVVMTIKEMQVKNSFPMTVDLGSQKIQFNVSAGVCYAVLKETRLEHEFVKENLPSDGAAPDGSIDLDAALDNQ